VRRRLELLAGDRAAVVDWGCGGAWELRERAELKAGSERAEEVWRGGPAAASSSPELRRRAVVLWVFWAGNGRKSKGKRMRGSSRCWGACELGCWGSALRWPRRRQGGGRRAHWGDVAKGGGVQRGGKWVQRLRRCHMRRRESRRWLGPALSGGRRWTAGGGEAEREAGG